MRVQTWRSDVFCLHSGPSTAGSHQGQLLGPDQIGERLEEAAGVHEVDGQTGEGGEGAEDLRDGELQDRLNHHGKVVEVEQQRRGQHDLEGSPFDGMDFLLVGPRLTEGQQDQDVADEGDHAGGDGEHRHQRSFHVGGVLHQVAADDSEDVHQKTQRQPELGFLQLQEEHGAGHRHVAVQRQEAEEHRSAHVVQAPGDEVQLEH